MTAYSAPTQEMNFVINELANMPALQQLSAYADSSADLIEAVIEEAAKFAGGVLSPINYQGDTLGSQVVDKGVVTAKGFREAYQQFAEGGWVGVSQPMDFGGQGLPQLMLAAVSEMWNGANMSFALNPMLSTGAIEALLAHASDDLKQTYLPKLVSGEWTGTMNLTESNAGSDLSAVRSKATPNGDHYLIEGQKIYITWGDHDCADNVIHLVLARLPDAPEGVKGISLFLVPKFLLNADGSPGERNDVYSVSVEHKLGIHASPTCVMSFGDDGGAVGYLVGRENEGLAHMFTMMNSARLGVGIQGVGIAERAYQQARDYARDRVQGFAPDSKDRVAIIRHPDIRRMLMIMRSLTEAARAICYTAYSSLDFSHASCDQDEAKHHGALVDLLVPVAKAWSTEIAQEVASLGVQIHGGMGYVEETGAAQHFRDARITTIYEGTTGIQALDLVGRKILRDQGRAVQALISNMREEVDALTSSNPELSQQLESVTRGIQQLAEAVDWLLNESPNIPEAANGAAFNMMMLMGTVLGAFHMVRAADKANRYIEAGEGDNDFYRAKVATATFYVEHILPRASGYLDAIVMGSGSIMAMDEAQF